MHLFQALTATFGTSNIYTTTNTTSTDVIMTLHFFHLKQIVGSTMMERKTAFFFNNLQILSLLVHGFTSFNYNTSIHPHGRCNQFIAIAIAAQPHYEFRIFDSTINSTVNCESILLQRSNDRSQSKNYTSNFSTQVQIKAFKLNE